MRVRLEDAASLRLDRNVSKKKERERESFQLDLGAETLIRLDGHLWRSSIHVPTRKCDSGVLWCVGVSSESRAHRQPQT